MKYLFDAMQSPQNKTAHQDKKAHYSVGEKIAFPVAFFTALSFAIAVVPMSAFNTAHAGEKTVMVGGQKMYPSKDIVDNAVNSADHTTLVAAVKAAGLVDTLKSAGPFTVFAPTNEAFEKLPAGTVESLLKPEAKPTLTKILTYHVVAGKLDTKALTAEIKKGHGKATLKTVAGGILIATAQGKDILIQDEKGGTAKITIRDVYQSNGVIQVVDAVLLPN